jgi:hypothetical protein
MTWKVVVYGDGMDVVAVADVEQEDVGVKDNVWEA